MLEFSQPPPNLAMPPPNLAVPPGQPSSNLMPMPMQQHNMGKFHMIYQLFLPLFLFNTTTTTIERQNKSRYCLPKRNPRG